MEFKSFMEALKGKQHKIDKNGQIDSHDFKLLRKEEADLFEAGPHDPDFVEKSARHERLYTYHKRMGNDTEAAKHKAEIDKLYKKEETEELDEIHRMKTKLSSLDAVSHMSVARQKLSNLMKSGKARGALIANKRRTLNMGEEVEIEETWSKDQLASIHSMHDKMSKSVGLDPSKKYGTIITKSKKDREMDQAIKDEMKEEFEQIDELKNATLKSYIKKATDLDDNRSISSHAVLATAKHLSGSKSDTGEKDATKSRLRSANISKALDKLTREEVEQIDELSPKTLGSYVKKATSSNDARSISNLSSKAAYKLATTDGEDEGEEEDHKSYKRSASISKAVNRLTKEEVEQIEERNKQNAMMRKTMDASRGARYKLNNPVPDAEPEHKTAQAHNKAIGRALRSEDKMTTTKDKAGKLVSFKYEGDWKKSTEKKEGSGKAANLAGQAMQKMAKANEQAPVAPVPDRKYIKGTPENKALKAARKPINGMPTNKIKEEKDEQEYGYEGDMALNQLATLTRCAEMIKEILKPDTDMPEWVQSKITLATDYIQTAADYMHSEMNEAKSVEVKVNAAGDAAHEEKWEAVKKIKKPVKESFDDEGNLIANKVSYKEFMLEYTPGPGGVTQIKGRSYGASYSDPEGADDYDDKKPMKPAAEKRGRGRPAGAKSGARKITGTSKLMNK